MEDIALWQDPAAKASADAARREVLELSRSCGPALAQASTPVLGFPVADLRSQLGPCTVLDMEQPRTLTGTDHDSLLGEDECSSGRLLHTKGASSSCPQGAWGQAKSYGQNLHRRFMAHPTVHRIWTNPRVQRLIHDKRFMFAIMFALVLIIVLVTVLGDWDEDEDDEEEGSHWFGDRLLRALHT